MNIKSLINSNFCTDFHNFCIIEIKDNNNLIFKGKYYNNASSVNYQRLKYIDNIYIQGPGNNFEISLVDIQRDEQYDNTTHDWCRSNNPTLSHVAIEGNTDDYIYYNAKVWFMGVKSKINTIRMRAGQLDISVINIVDIRNNPISIDIENGQEVTIGLFIYFKVDFSLININTPYSPYVLETLNNAPPGALFKKEIIQTTRNVQNTFSGPVPIYLFDLTSSIFGGSTGKDVDILRIWTYRVNVPDVGYLPLIKNTELAITKSPMPPIALNGQGQNLEVGQIASSSSPLKKYLVKGGINEFQLLYSENIAENGKVYINNRKNEGYKGLIRGIVIPYVGMIPLPNEAIYPAKHVRLETSTIFNEEQAKNQKISPCYIPEEYVLGGEQNNLMSMKYNGLYLVPPTVRRYYPATEDKWKTHDEVEEGIAFFSDLVPNYGERRVRGLIHHIPLTENRYCGAETIIPCSPGHLINEDGSFSEFYGYYVDYISMGSKYISLDYAVTGEFIYKIKNLEGESYIKTTFPYILEYSYDGNIFETACDFSSGNYSPYRRIDFSINGEPISAPIWRIRSNVNAATVYETGTTHSDPYISDVAGTNINGYDPYFIFVGLKKDNDNFVYETEGENIMSVSGDFKITVPYLCHENDNFFLSGEIKGYSNIFNEEGGVIHG